MLAAYLVLAGELGLILIATPRRELLPWYLILHCVYLILLTGTFWLPRIRPEVLSLFFAIQSALVVLILSLNPEMGIVTALLPVLAYQAALVFSGLRRWFWIGWLVLLAISPLMFYLGMLTGLARGLLPAIGTLVLATYVIVTHEIEAARATSQKLLSELQEKHQQLQAYAERVDELAAIEERSRLARELHDSVSQTLFSILLNTRSAQILLEQNPSQIKPQLAHLQELAQNALTQMRSLITQWHPAGK